jgi:hypothetical protein
MNKSACLCCVEEYKASSQRETEHLIRLFKRLWDEDGMVYCRMRSPFMICQPERIPQSCPYRLEHIVDVK